MNTEGKLYIVHTTDTLMLRLLDYYENEGDKRFLPIIMSVVCMMT